MARKGAVVTALLVTAILGCWLGGWRVDAAVRDCDKWHGCETTRCGQRSAEQCPDYLYIFCQWEECSSGLGQECCVLPQPPYPSDDKYTDTCQFEDYMCRFKFCPCGA